MNNDEIIYRYSRAQAIADGFQIEVTPTAKEAGILFPVFLTRAVYEASVVIPPGVEGQDDSEGFGTFSGCSVLPFDEQSPDMTAFLLRFTCEMTIAPRALNLIAHCGPIDIDRPEPAITIMMPDED